jgi:hypothetical protein
MYSSHGHSGNNGIGGSSSRGVPSSGLSMPASLSSSGIREMSLGLDVQLPASNSHSMNSILMGGNSVSANAGGGGLGGRFGSSGALAMLVGQSPLEEVTAGLDFDYSAGANTGNNNNNMQQTMPSVTPQQAQAELGAMLHSLQRGQLARVNSSGFTPDARMAALLDTDGSIMDEEDENNNNAFQNARGRVGATVGTNGIRSNSPEGFTRTTAGGEPEEDDGSGSNGIRVEENSSPISPDDGLAFPSMNRGASNIQAALEELQSQEMMMNSGGQQLFVQSQNNINQQSNQQQHQHFMQQQQHQQHVILRQFGSSSHLPHTNPHLHQSHSNSHSHGGGGVRPPSQASSSQWSEHEDYHSQHSQDHDNIYDSNLNMINSINNSSNNRLEYDDSKYSHPAYTAAAAAAAAATQQQQQQTSQQQQQQQPSSHSGLTFHGLHMHNASLQHVTGHPYLHSHYSNNIQSNLAAPPSLALQQQQHNIGGVVNSSSGPSAHHHSHSSHSHSHSHSHSVPPSVAAVVEADEVAEADETRDGSAGAQSAATGAARIKAELIGLTNDSSSSIINNIPQRGTSPSPVGGIVRNSVNAHTPSRSGGSSPSPHSHPLHWSGGGVVVGGSSHREPPSPTGSNHSNSGSRRHSGHLIFPTPIQATTTSPDEVTTTLVRVLGRSPSADSLSQQYRNSGAGGGGGSTSLNLGCSMVPPQSILGQQPPVGVSLNLSRHHSLNSNHSSSSTSIGGLAISTSPSPQPPFSAGATAGRELHLHPSRQQAQARCEQQASAASASSYKHISTADGTHPHLLQVPAPRLFGSLSPQSAPPLGAGGVVSSPSPSSSVSPGPVNNNINNNAASDGSPPAMNPSFGRSFSHDHVHALHQMASAAAASRENAYYSDDQGGGGGGGPGSARGWGSGGPRSSGSVVSSGAITPTHSLASSSAPSSALTAASRHFHSPGHVCALCISGDGIIQACDDLHLLSANTGSYSGSFPQFAQSGYASASAASSGTTTPLRGPRGAPSSLFRGSNLNELAHLQLLHAQSSSSTSGGGTGGVTSLLPLCPLGAAAHHSGSSASAAAAAAAALVSGIDRIGAYSREERARRVARYKDKRQRRCWTKRVLYQVRQTFAVSRRRVGGRFIKKQNSGCPCADYCLPGCINYKPEFSEEALTGHTSGNGIHSYQSQSIGNNNGKLESSNGASSNSRKK